jgi:multidrug efflux system outer membrane protein
MPTHPSPPGPARRNIGRNAAVAVLVAMLASGCSMIPAYERPGLPVPPQFPAAPEEPSGQPPAADIAWRDFIAEPRLERLVELALHNNRDLRVAALRVEQSQAQYLRTRSGLFPSLDLRTSYTRQRVSDPSGTEMTTGSANLSAASTAYELDFFGRVRSSSEQALQQYLQTEEAQRSAQIALIAEVATQYFALREAAEQLALARQTLDLVAESYRLNTLSFEVGQIDALDLRTAEGQLQNAQINVLTYERQASQSENQLVLLIGAPLPADLPPAEPFGSPDVLADVPAGLPADLVLRRPDILEAEHALLAANANVGVARAAFFPSISLTGSAGRTSDALGSLLGSGGTSVLSLAPQLTLPLFNAGSNRANLAAAEAATQIEVASYERTIQTAFREVADALVATSSYAQEIEAQEAAVLAQTQRFTLADERYRQGDDSYLTVLQAQQDLYSAQQGRLRAQRNRASSQISLYRALGGGWQ